MAIFINQNKKIKSIFVNVNGEKKSISSSWVNRDGIPTKVFQIGHKHIWEENVVITNWTLTSRYNATYSSTTKKYTFNTAMSGTPQIHFEVTVPDTAEFEITYYNWTSGKLSITLDGEEILNKSYVTSTTDTIILVSGTHKLDITWEPISSASIKPTIALNEISYSNHICNECGETQAHIYTEVITKEPTCTEKGEKELTCTKCGYSYIEEIPEFEGPHTDENGDDVCDICGHKHVWEENTDMIEWTRNSKSSSSSSVVQTGNTWKLNYDTTNQYTTYTLNGYWDIEVPEDIEYTFAYNTGFISTNDRVRIYLDGEIVIDVSADTAGSKLKTVHLTKGEHAIQLSLNKQNTVTTATYASITLNPIEALNHVCTECGEKKTHHYAEGIVIKEPTCTETGEKEFTCTKCNRTKIEEIDALGHHYVDGVCDRCGSLNLVKKRFWSAISSTSETEDTGGGHYDMATLLGTYSPNIEITEDMRDGEYLLLDFYVRYPFYGGAIHYGEVDGINGLSMLQRYDEETGTWGTVYSYNLSYQTVGTYMAAQEGGYTFSPGNGIMKSFQLEKGTYRAYGRFSAGRGCGSSVAHYYYSYHISVDLCQVGK